MVWHQLFWKIMHSWYYRLMSSVCCFGYQVTLKIPKVLAI